MFERICNHAIATAVYLFDESKVQFMLPWASPEQSWAETGLLHT
jgi:hypothetical protein